MGNLTKFKRTPTVYQTETGKQIAVPQVPGLRAEIQGEGENQRLVFLAQEGNPYGLEVNQWAGEFKPNVTMAETQTGGLVLDSMVVLQILNQRLAEIPKQKDRWLVALPLDIRGLDKSLTIKITFSVREAGPETYPSVNIKVPTEGLFLVNSLPDTEELRVARTFLVRDNKVYYNPILRTQPFFERIVEGYEMCYLSVGGKFNLPAGTTIESRFGDAVDKVSAGTVFVAYGLGQEQGPIGPEKVLSVSGVPIFIAANGQ